MTESSNFFELFENQELGWLRIGQPNKMLRETRIQIQCKEFVFNDNIQIILNKSPILKDLNDADITTFEKILKPPKKIILNIHLVQENQRDSILINKNFLKGLQI